MGSYRLVRIHFIYRARGNMNKSIDIRIMKLNKWYVPKSYDLEKLEDPIILGFFDELKIRKVEDHTGPGRLHPFTAGYNRLMEWKWEEKREVEDFSTQEQILFLNICDKDEEEGIAFTEETVKEFWDDKSQVSPYIFVSMIHINHRGNLKKALRNIKSIFKKDYLSYISFDYCDIVLFMHNIGIRDFLDKIKQLFEMKHETEKIIFDTFSLVSFWPPKVLDEMDRGCLRETKAEKFCATINVSVRDYEGFKDWYEKEIKSYGSGMNLYYMYGRHDVSIINEAADTHWLIWMMEMLHNPNNQKLFWTFETFIKVKADAAEVMEADTYMDAVQMGKEEIDKLKKTYETIKGNLQNEINQLQKAIEDSSIHDMERYILPVYEVRDCICSIVKNGFAEEFVCCIYESFLHFVVYMRRKIQKLNGNSAKNQEDKCKVSEGMIAKGYDSYFTAINTLVNSIIHTDRQFVQATAFNAAFCSVPPKIMAFYNVYVYRLKQILKDDEFSYTFLICPSFSPSMLVEQISLNDSPPSDRILTVAANEKTLYEIEAAMCQMVHELAHYIGHRLRCRGVRRHKIVSSLLKWISDECRIDKKIYHMLVRRYTKESSEGQELYTDGYLYSTWNLGRQLLQDLSQIEEMKGFFSESYGTEKSRCADYCDEFLENCGIEAALQGDYVEYYKEQYDAIKWVEFSQCIREMDDPKKAEKYKCYIELINSAYRECYADLQMILVLAMGAEDYLSTFHINIHQKVSSEILIRISTVFRVMKDCGFWREPTEQDGKNYQEVYQIIEQYNRVVEEYTDSVRGEDAKLKVNQIMEKAKYFDFEDGVHLKRTAETSAQKSDAETPRLKNVPFTDMAIFLYEYLLEVMGESLERYSDEDELSKIKKIRTVIKEIFDFKDIISVFDCVESELETYKQEIYKMKIMPMGEKE